MLRLAIAALIVFLAAGWAVDRSILRSELTRQWGLYADLKTKFNYLDPLRWQIDGNESERRAELAVTYGTDCDTSDLVRVVHSLQRELEERK